MVFCFFPACPNKGFSFLHRGPPVFIWVQAAPQRNRMIQPRVDPAEARLSSLKLAQMIVTLCCNTARLRRTWVSRLHRLPSPTLRPDPALHARWTSWSRLQQPCIATVQRFAEWALPSPVPGCCFPPPTSLLSFQPPMSPTPNAEDATPKHHGSAPEHKAASPPEHKAASDPEHHSADAHNNAAAATAPADS